MNTKNLFPFINYDYKYASDFSKCLYNGVYQIGADSATDGPNAMCYGVLLVLITSSYKMQQFFDFINSRIYVRTYSSSKWTTWREI